VVLREVVTREAGRVRRLQKLQAFFVELPERSLPPIDPVEQVAWCSARW